MYYFGPKCLEQSLESIYNRVRPCLTREPPLVIAQRANEFIPTPKGYRPVFSSENTTIDQKLSDLLGSRSLTEATDAFQSLLRTCCQETNTHQPAAYFILPDHICVSPFFGLLSAFPMLPVPLHPRGEFDSLCVRILVQEVTYALIRTLFLYELGNVTYSQETRDLILESGISLKSKDDSFSFDIPTEDRQKFSTPQKEIKRLGIDGLARWISYAATGQFIPSILIDEDDGTRQDFPLETYVEKIGPKQFIAWGKSLLEEAYATKTHVDELLKREEKRLSLSR